MFPAPQDEPASSAGFTSKELRGWGVGGEGEWLLRGWSTDIEHRGTGDCVYSPPCVSQAWWYTSAILAHRRQGLA